jgi:hypothetical protein
MSITGPCGIEGCEIPRRYKLHCEKHYRQLKRGTKPTLRNAGFVGCVIDGCDGPRKHKGMCRPHWRELGNGRAENLKRRFKLTTGQYDEMALLQCGLCAICGEECATNRRLAVDHDHATGKIRGLLCQACNTSLGKFKDSPALLRRAANYLEGG